ncbi:hypothetical protein EQG68_00065 [Flavobacterium piscinae]|uniref:Uncharacterized protein n=1 Tax=Flavobacterium piscinae TaxID=2506424 RepID=A0A4Q1KZN3_9FLAO|nr:hypothetical protein [Flavobacterium piscinae]RXR35325.1 hypothetical protein EQG68_00065 [Flavobacterium piscinae]
MKKTLLSIWKDPVWSKVISVAIIAIVGGIYTAYNWGRAKNFLKEQYNNFINLNVPLYYIILFILILGLFIWVLSKLNITKVKTKKDHFIGDDYRYTFGDVNILCRYSVGVSNYTGKPFIFNLKVYCNKHTPALELNEGYCSVRDCSNDKVYIDLFKVEKILEADIIHRWEEYDKK